MTVPGVLLPSTAWETALQHIDRTFAHMSFISRFEAARDRVVQGRIDAVEAQIEQISLRSQQPLSHSDARDIRFLFNRMRMPLPAPLVQLLSPLAPY